MALIETIPDGNSHRLRRWVFWTATVMIIWPPLQAAIDLAWQASHIMDMYLLFPMQVFWSELEESFRLGRYTAAIVSWLCLIVAALLLLLSYRRWRAGLWFCCAIGWVPTFFAAGNEIWGMPAIRPLDYTLWQWFDIVMGSDLFFSLGLTGFISKILQLRNLADNAPLSDNRAKIILPSTWTAFFCFYLLLCIEALRWVFWPDGWRDDPGYFPEMREAFAASCAAIAIFVLCVRRPACLQLAIVFLWLCAVSYICMLVFGWTNVPVEVDGLARISQEFGISFLAAIVWTAYFRTSKTAMSFTRSDPTIFVRPSDF